MQQQQMMSCVSISSLFGPELRSGVLLLELLQLLQPGCVDWRLANRLLFRRGGARVQLLALENCQMALRIAQEELGLPLVSMSPHDVVLGRRKVILSLVYQLMRYHTMQLLESITAASQQQQQQQDADGLELAVDLAFVTPGLTPAQRQSNAQYALSVADKLGCSLFLVWEDLVDLQPRMVLVLLASLMYMDQTRGRGQQQQQPSTVSSRE
ncbi:hypothetical protein OEZ86_010687 [Tetradesmus obliquus]|nr:hypothetical protein OEZ86_010687 [Tetradesmus obliquus]